jgi:hypothetical protein
MITLHTEPYCENCPDFEATTDMNAGMCINGSWMTTCRVTCKDRTKCKRMHDFLERKFANKETNHD